MDVCVLVQCVYLFWWINKKAMVALYHSPNPVCARVCVCACVWVNAVRVFVCVFWWINKRPMMGMYHSPNPVYMCARVCVFLSAVHVFVCVFWWIQKRAMMALYHSPNYVPLGWTFLHLFVLFIGTKTYACFLVMFQKISKVPTFSCFSVEDKCTMSYQHFSSLK